MDNSKSDVALVSDKKILETGTSNLILSLKKYQIKKKSLKSDILEIINRNLSKKKKYNHLLRIAINKKII